MPTVVTVLTLGFLIAVFFLLTPAKKLASLVRWGIPTIMVAVASLLIAMKQVTVGIPLIFAGLWLLRKARDRRNRIAEEAATKLVRTAALEVELNIETGVMEGLVLVSQYEGRALSTMSSEELDHFREFIEGDAQSSELLDTYFQSRFPAGRENT